MSLHLTVSNIGRSQGRGFLTTDAEICDYVWRVRVNARLIAKGTVERYDRANEWHVLVQRVLDSVRTRRPEQEITLPRFPGDERPLRDAMRRSEEAPMCECVSYWADGLMPHGVHFQECCPRCRTTPPPTAPEGELWLLREVEKYARIAVNQIICTGDGETCPPCENREQLANALHALVRARRNDL